MKRIMVCLKRVVDHNVRIRIKPDNTGIDIDGAKMSINPFDEVALEEGLRIKERGQADEVVVVSVGSGAWQQQLRTGLAMGADRAVLVATEQRLEPLTVARTLHAVVEREQPELVLLGRQAIDGDLSQTGPMLAALWARPQATFASKVVIEAGVATVTRDVDAGWETLAVDLPAVITTALRLNTPRYVKLPEIVKAKRKPLEILPWEQFAITPTRQFETVSTEPPPSRGDPCIVDDVGALITELSKRGMV